MAVLDKVHLQCWNEALQAKFQGKGKPYGKEEFDKLMGKYNVRPSIMTPTCEGQTWTMIGC